MLINSELNLLQTEKFNRVDVTDIMDVAGVTDVTDITDVAGVTDVTDITDVAGVTDVTDITGGTVRHMALYDNCITG